MRSKIVNTAPQTYVLVFDTGDEVMDGIKNFATENALTAASFTALGAFSEAEIAYFDIATKEYEKIPVKEQVEVLSIVGDISLLDGETQIHAHAVLGRRDGTVRGGHLMKAIVRPTLEVVVTAAPSYLFREMNDDYGIPLIKLG